MSRAPVTVVVAILCLSSLQFVRTGIAPVPSYIAAVYEHLVNLNPEPQVSLSREEALKHMMESLDVYEKQAALAAEQVIT